MVEPSRVEMPSLAVAEQRKSVSPLQETVFGVEDLGVSYDGRPALRGATLEIYRNRVTALIGPSGCGKSTFIRCLNRLNDLVAGARVDGKVLYHGQDLYGDGVDPVEVRRRIGMVFQKP
ncbi:MAG TPA: ATP-binding cassette domain-containing protein, partial [Polyangia bacterium]